MKIKNTNTNRHNDGGRSQTNGASSVLLHHWDIFQSNRNVSLLCFFSCFFLLQTSVGWVTNSNAEITIFTLHLFNDARNTFLKIYRRQKHNARAHTHITKNTPTTPTNGQTTPRWMERKRNKWLERCYG